jgi:N-acetyl-alpha-D-glucosaminyl L-malate synthase BshA
VLDVVRIFHRVAQEMPAKLLMVGDGPDRDAAYMLAKELQISQHVYFLGKQEHIENFLSCSDVLLFPSEYESFGLAALEAMASESVVIASNGGGLPDLIESGVDGFMAEVGDVETMARQAMDILRDPARRRRMGAAAREKAIAKFLPEQIVPIYERIYEAVVGG